MVTQKGKRLSDQTKGIIKSFKDQTGRQTDKNLNYYQLKILSSEC